MKSNKNWKVSAVLFLLSQNISLFGSSIVGYAVIWHITLETSSGFWMMMATIFSNLPQIIISLYFLIYFAQKSLYFSHLCNG